MVGDVHQEKWWSTAGSEDWRQPWRRVHVPGEGPTNVGGWDAHEHRGGVGVRLPYLIWLEVGRKGVVDGGAARVFTGGDGSTTFCWLGCRRAMKRLLGSFYGLMCSAGALGWGEKALYRRVDGEAERRRSFELAGAVEDAARV
jgi:hypothetical protein